MVHDPLQMSEFHIMTSISNKAFLRFFRNLLPRGPSIKYVTLEGKGVQEGVTVCDRERGVKSM